MPKRLPVQPLDDAAFAPFGKILRVPSQGRRDFIDELENLRASARARLSLAALEPTAMPMTVSELEAHPYSAQAFIPVDVSRYLVLVAPKAADGGPDAERLQAFVAAPGMGILYAAGTWHHGMRVLDRPGIFTVLTFVDGTEGDEVFVPLAEPATIVLA
jgi:ureidoglycolate lyase